MSEINNLIGQIFTMRGALKRIDGMCSEAGRYNEIVADRVIDRVQEIVRKAIGSDRLNDAEIEKARAALASKDAEIERLKRAVVTFAGPHALRWACEFGLPDGHLHPKHYDLLAECGARVDDFVRAELPNQAAGPTPQPRNEVSGSETPGNRSGDPE